MTAQYNDDNSLAFIAVTISFTAISTVAVCLRLLSSKLSSMKFWWDDGFISLSLVGQRLGTRQY